MAKIEKKRIITAALIGGIIFSGIVTLLDYLLGRDFSLMRLLFYLAFWQQLARKLVEMVIAPF